MQLKPIKVGHSPVRKEGAKVAGFKDFIVGRGALAQAAKQGGGAPPQPGTPQPLPNYVQDQVARDAASQQPQPNPNQPVGPVAPSVTPPGAPTRYRPRPVGGR